MSIFMGETNLKLVILGPGGVGKTTLTNKFVTGLFKKDTRITLGVQFHFKQIEIEEYGKINLQIWDFGGEERFRFILNQYMKGANGVIFMFSITDLSSLLKMDEWMDLVKKQKSDIPVIMAGGKADLVGMRHVFPNLAEEYREKWNCKEYIEVSSKTGKNVQELFESIAIHMILTLTMLSEATNEKQNKNRNG